MDTLFFFSCLPSNSKGHLIYFMLKKDVLPVRVFSHGCYFLFFSLLSNDSKFGVRGVLRFYDRRRIRFPEHDLKLSINPSMLYFYIKEYRYLLSLTFMRSVICLNKLEWHLNQYSLLGDMTISCICFLVFNNLAVNPTCLVGVKVCLNYAVELVDCNSIV